MMPSSYGWAIAALALLAMLALAIWWIRAQGKRERALAQAQDLAAGNRVVADANRAAADARARDLGPTPGLRVRERDKPTGEL